MSSLYNTASIYNAINGIVGGGGGTGGVSTTLIKSGTTAVSTGTNTYTIPLPNGLNEGVYLVEANYKTTGSPPTATAFYIYIDQSVLANTIYYTNHNTSGSILFQHPTNYINTPVGTTTLTSGVGIIVSAGTTSGTLYYAVSAVALLNGGTGGGGGSVSGISSLTAGTAISLTGTTTAPTINNTGVTSAVAGSGISVSSGTGAVTITNSGVRTLTAGSGINLTGSANTPTISNTGVLSASAGAGLYTTGTTGNITFINTGVTSLTADTGISLSGTTGPVTIRNTGVISITGTTTLGTSTQNVILPTSFGGAYTLALPRSITGLNVVNSNFGQFTNTQTNSISLFTAGPILLKSSMLLSAPSGTISLDLGSGSGNTLNNLKLGTDVDANNFSIGNVNNLVVGGTINVAGTITAQNDISMTGQHNLLVHSIVENGTDPNQIVYIQSPLLYNNAPITPNTALMTFNSPITQYIPDVFASIPQYDTLNNPISQTPNISIASMFGTGSVSFTDITQGGYSIPFGKSDTSQVLAQLKAQIQIVFDISAGSTSTTGALYIDVSSQTFGGDRLIGQTFNQFNPFTFNASNTNLAINDVVSGTDTPTTLVYTLTYEDTFILPTLLGFGLGYNNLFVSLNVGNYDSGATPMVIKSYIINTQFEWLAYKQ